MLKVTSPWVRETPVQVPGPDGLQRHIVIRVDPPGTAISLRLRRSKMSYSISVKDLWHIVTSGEYQAPAKKAVPKAVTEPDIPHGFDSASALAYCQATATAQGEGHCAG
jgi:hypothetical protein